jgi:archaellum biogenesis ATPase FlaH
MAVEKKITSKILDRNFDMTLQDGFSYLIKDNSKMLGSRLVSNKTVVGENVLYVTRKSPKTLMKDDEITNQTLIWLTYNKGPDCIEPTNISRLSQRIQDFLKNNKRATIILDGLEYLTSQNDFSTILHFLQLMNDKIMISDSKLILSINPNAFKPNELAMIEREMETLYDNE